MEYKLVEASSGDILEITVNNFIEQGYEPHGNLAVYTHYETVWYAQPMIKSKDAEEK